MLFQTSSKQILNSSIQLLIITRKISSYSDCWEIYSIYDEKNI